MLDLDRTLRRIGDTLGTGDVTLLFRRGLRRHVDDLGTLRETGLTWDQIARRLTALGVRHKRGQAVSAHQLRTEYARLRKETLVPPSAERMVAPDHIVPRPGRLGRAEANGAPAASRTRLAELLSTRAKPLELDD